jgi:cytochrome c oxidase subunit 2
VKKTKHWLAGLVVSVIGVTDAHAEYALNLMEGVTETSRQVYGLHMYMLWVCVAIAVVVFGAMFYSILNHRKSRGAVAANFHENTTVEVVWTIIPFLILVSIAWPATKVMLEMYETSNADMTIKVTGYQWKWRYEYLDDQIDFFSSLDAKSNQVRQLGSGKDPAKEAGEHYLLSVDNPVVIPAGKKIRFLFTGADVIHAWWVPDFGWKKDAIPGYITDAWVKVDKPGTYRGQCTELCGRDHAFMPIVVEVKAESEYRRWVESHKLQSAKASQEAGKEFARDDLMAKGAEIYNTNCAGCHQMNGEGVPGTFPAIKGSPLATGKIADHIAIVVKGKGMMPAFGEMLNPAEIASVVTFQRNALGNAVGDMAQPKDIQ